LHEAALHGSSHYDLPGVLRWFTANIGVHHIHHLCSHVPYYRVNQVFGGFRFSLARRGPKVSDQQIA
jgi:fatty acid desaturase